MQAVPPDPTHLYVKLKTKRVQLKSFKGAPQYREAWLVFEVWDLCWVPKGKRYDNIEQHVLKPVPDLNQSVLEQLKAKILIFWRLVLSEGVVHVKAVELDFLQREGPVDKDPAEKMRGLVRISLIAQYNHACSIKLKYKMTILI